MSDVGEGLEGPVVESVAYFADELAFRVGYFDGDGDCSCAGCAGSLIGDGDGDVGEPCAEGDGVEVDAGDDEVGYFDVFSGD